MELNASFKRSNFALNILPSAFGQSSGAGFVLSSESSATISTLPNTGYLFSQWTGDTQYLADPNSSTTIVTIPSNEVNLTPTFTPEDISCFGDFRLQRNGVGGGTIPIRIDGDHYSCWKWPEQPKRYRHGYEVFQMDGDQTNWDGKRILRTTPSPF